MDRYSAAPLSADGRFAAFYAPDTIAAQPASGIGDVYLTITPFQIEFARSCSDVNTRAQPVDSLREIPYSPLRHMPQTLKPASLRSGDSVRIVSLSQAPWTNPASPPGIKEIARLGYQRSSIANAPWPAAIFSPAPRRAQCRAERSAHRNRHARNFLLTRRLRLELLARRPERSARNAQNPARLQRPDFAADFPLAKISLGHSLRSDGGRGSR